MPSAYLLAKDQIEQARAILANEVWFDAELDHLFVLAQTRLAELERKIDAPVGAAAPVKFPAPPRARLMPWLNR